jgi:signal transduction histidine kinase
LSTLSRLNKRLLIRNWLLLCITIAIIGFVEIIALMRLNRLEKTQTQLRKKEEKLTATIIKLEEATRFKSEFLANMSHEIRTPMNAILGFAQVMQEEYYGPLNEKQKGHLAYILAGGKHLLGLINDILDLSKVEAGKMELEPSRFSLPLLLQGSLELFREKARVHGIELSLEVDDDVGMIVADERKVRQVIFNLLSNAVKFTPDGGKITASARPCARASSVENKVRRLKAMKSSAIGEDVISPPTPWIEISVKDTGIGLESHDLETIFEPFQQVDGSYIRKFAGTGLGLALVRRFVGLHGGRAWAQSPGQGKGATFSFSLPIQSCIGPEGDDHETNTDRG